MIYLIGIVLVNALGGFYGSGREDRQGDEGQKLENSMKIAIITPVFPPKIGGIGKVAFRQARELHNPLCPEESTGH